LVQTLGPVHKDGRMRLHPLMIFAAGVALAGGTSALAADESAPVATASRTTDQKIADWLKDAPPVEAADDQSGPEGPPPPPDRRVHGEFGAAIGTGGYRSAYGVVQIPIGKTGSATIAAATGRDRFAGPWLGGPLAGARLQGCAVRRDPAAPLGDVTQGADDPLACAPR
jgi:hypothetical protein